MQGEQGLIGAGAPQGGAAGLVKETTSAAFRVDVIAESQRQPVLVEFWSARSDLCKQMRPVLEKAVKAAGGKVKMAALNIDEHPQIAGQLGIQSVPAVVAFQRGQPVDGFMGALPESQVKGFIERLVGPVTGGTDEAIAEAEAALAAGDAEEAANLYAAVLGEEPDNLKALGGLAKLLVEAGEIEQAREVLASAPDKSEANPAIAAARAALDLAEQAAALGDLAEFEQKLAADPNDHQARFDLALALNGKGRREEAADSLLEIIRKNRTWNEEAARKQLLQLFEAWGMMDEATLAARRKLSAVLYS